VLREAAGVTGREFARRGEWDNSKVSRIESGHQIPADEEIRRWCEIAGLPGCTDDLIAIAANVRAARGKGRSRGRRPGAAMAVVAALASAAAGFAHMVPAQADPVPQTLPGCEQQDQGPVISGTGPGGTASGPQAVLAFEYGYYRLRSAQAARAVVADGATVAPAHVIQAGIDHVPVGTLYCVRINATPADLGAGGQRWAVTVTEQRPDTTPIDHRQVITTMRDRSGRVLITNITTA